MSNVSMEFPRYILVVGAVGAVILPLINSLLRLMGATDSWLTIVTALLQIACAIVVGLWAMRSIRASHEILRGQDD